MALQSDPPKRKTDPKSNAAVTFLLAACWIASALLVSRTVLRMLTGTGNAIVHALLDAALLFGGLYWIASRTVAGVRPSSSVGFVKRSTQWHELGLGLVLGWAIALLLIVPALFTRALRTSLSFDGFHIGRMLSGLLLLVLLALATQMIFFGLAFRSLVLASSPATAAILIALLSSTLFLHTRQGDLIQAIFVGCASLLFALAALRTRALWLSLGLQVGWGAALVLLFGVNSFYWPIIAGPVRTYVGGSRWLTGGALGPEASLPAFLFVLAGLALVWRATRTYAWHYTFDPIVGAAYPLRVTPPAEHARLEEQAAKQPVPLVQIQGLGSESAGPGPTVDHQNHTAL